MDLHFSPPASLHQVSGWRGLAVAAFLTALMVGFRAAIAPYVGSDVPLLPFLLSVTVTAAVAGLGAGLVATVFGALAGTYFFTAPTFSLSPHELTGGDVARIWLFVTEGALASWLISSRQAALERAERGQHEFRVLFETSGVGMALADTQGRLTRVNDRFGELTGRPAKELVGASIDTFTHPDDLAHSKAQIGRLVGGEINESREEKRYVRPDGSVRWVDLRLTRQPPVQGRVPGTSAVVTDITERRAAEVELRRLLAELEQRVQERTADLEAFTYTVSHDLRAPLRGIHGLSQALVEDYGDKLEGDARVYLDRIARAATRMERLIDDLLAYSRLGRRNLEQRPVELRPIVEASLAQVEADVKAREAKVEVTGQFGLVRAHGPVLQQVLVNLVSNALKFVAPGEAPEVSIEGSQQGGMAVIAVRDRGIGLAEEHRELVFKPFERLHSNDLYEGSGVGLAIVRRGMERMGGAVSVHAREGGGTEFCISLPLVR